jgi:hypothetical protein
MLDRIAVRLGVLDAASASASASLLGDLALEATRDGRRLSVLEGWEAAP